MFHPRNPPMLSALGARMLEAGFGCVTLTAGILGFSLLAQLQPNLHFPRWDPRRPAKFKEAWG